MISLHFLVRLASESIKPTVLGVITCYFVGLVVACSIGQSYLVKRISSDYCTKGSRNMGTPTTFSPLLNA